MKLGYREEIYDEWEDENNIPFCTKFTEYPPLDEECEVYLDEYFTLPQRLIIRELEEIRQLLKELKKRSI